MLKGAISRTVCTLGPEVLGARVRVMALGSKSGGKYLLRTLRSDMVAVVQEKVGGYVQAVLDYLALKD